MTETLPEVLIIDDEPDIRQLFVALTKGHFSPLLASNGTEGIALAKSRLPAAILLDILMPGLNGLTVCNKLRRDPITKNIPIVILTADNSPNNRIMAFDSGADDFITKPFMPEELIARIGSKIRRAQESQACLRQNTRNLYSCGNLVLDPAKFEARVEHRKIILSALEFDLIKFLVKNQSRVVSRKEILAEVWGNPRTEVRLIDVHIAMLRKKLAGFDHMIAAVYGIGYAVRPSAYI